MFKDVKLKQGNLRKTKLTKNEVKFRLRESFYLNVSLKEMLHIKNLKPELNIQKSSELFSLLIGDRKSR